MIPIAERESCFGVLLQSTYSNTIFWYPKQWDWKLYRAVVRYVPITTELDTITKAFSKFVVKNASLPIEAIKLN